MDYQKFKTVGVFDSIKNSEPQCCHEKNIAEIIESFERRINNESTRAELKYLIDRYISFHFPDKKIDFRLEGKENQITLMI